MYDFAPFAVALIARPGTSEDHKNDWLFPSSHLNPATQMKPFHSISELSILFGEDCYSVADGLLASGIKMISGGETADLSKWRRPGGTRADGSMFVVTGTYPIPNPEHVFVSTETLPSIWIERLRALTSDANTTDTGNAKGKWPWGNHETELLRALAAVASELWSRYDPEDNSTAPTNQQVIERLKQRGVAKRTAEVMATILRADGLPSGPRK